MLGSTSIMSASDLIQATSTIHYWSSEGCCQRLAGRRQPRRFRPLVVLATQGKGNGVRAEDSGIDDDEEQRFPSSSNGGGGSNKETSLAGSRRALSLIRKGFVEALAAIAVSRMKPNEAASEEVKETWLASRTATLTEKGTEPTLWEQRKKDRDAETARPGLTSPGFSFSAAGLLFPYHLGVAQCLIEHGYITENTPLSGSSAGAIVSAVIASGLSMHDAMLATKELALDCRNNGTAFRLGAVLRGSLEKCLPEDAHIRSSGRIQVAITQVFQSPKALIIGHFHSKEDLIDALHTSCFIPGYFAPRPVTLYRNRICMDGGITLFMPPTSAEITVRICAFPAAKLGLKGIGISPDCNPTRDRVSPRQLLNWALEPAADDILENLFNLGYQDALVWVNQCSSSVVNHGINNNNL